MPIPPMKPSAEERTTRIVLGMHAIRKEEKFTPLIDGLKDAWRDGYTANSRAERMLAALEPTDELISRIAFAIRDSPDGAARAALIAIRDILSEIAAQEPGR
jgi:hypothetical protein